MVTKRQKKFSPFNVYSVYFDTPDYLADTIINDVCMPMTILDERNVKTQEGKPYVMIYVKYNKKYRDRFNRLIDILRYNMLMYNNPEYANDCKELVERLKDDEVFGGNWS